MFAPINQTGVYTMLVHSTLFGGKSTTEPVHVIAQFSSMFADSTAPQISFQVAKFVNSLPAPLITDESPYSVQYILDGNEITLDDDVIPEGQHQLQIIATDESENTSTGLFEFTLDRTAPEILIKSPINNTKISELILDYAVLDDNLDEFSAILPNGTVLQNEAFLQISADDVGFGSHKVTISAKDLAGNTAEQSIFFDIEPYASPVPSVIMPASSSNAPTGIDSVLLWISLGIAIVITGFIIFSEKSRKSSKH
ncbi:hypothetical protein QVH35_05155 [Candidatus Nitrosotenuis chungbukensis]|uniref:hypothetical protein n=1 Tax=Candidatus Nitrosotenuis chungbukensis TaxID=1353246 RepID=UPI002673E43F|nr:hypothetical protein [Candidatus Nitrosotenuis chungbukensis]WKT58731.1 hypothetical protein QVH35_05155 [Candidatus Nitrosotenuis chungbukensis]